MQSRELPGAASCPPRCRAQRGCGLSRAEGLGAQLVLTGPFTSSGSGGTRLQPCGAGHGVPEQWSASAPHSRGCPGPRANVLAPTDTAARHRHVRGTRPRWGRSPAQSDRFSQERRETGVLPLHGAPCPPPSPQAAEKPSSTPRAPHCSEETFSSFLCSKLFGGHTLMLSPAVLGSGQDLSGHPGWALSR